MNLFKRLFLSILVLCMCTSSMFVFSACKEKEEEILPPVNLEGVNVEISLEEADQLLSQAGYATALKSTKHYTKTQLLAIINQIKLNILNSTAIEGTTSYFDGVADTTENCVVTTTESYFYVSDSEGVAETWYKNESDGLYEYNMYEELGSMIYSKTSAEPFANNNAVYDFCQGKFTFTCVTLTEEDIESFEIHGQNMYIKLNATIFNGEEVEVTESFRVHKGRIVKDDLSWEGFEITIEYKYDDKVDTTKLELPEGINWES